MAMETTSAVNSAPPTAFQVFPQGGNPSSVSSLSIQSTPHNTTAAAAAVQPRQVGANIPIENINLAPQYPPPPSSHPQYAGVPYPGVYTTAAAAAAAAPEVNVASSTTPASVPPMVPTHPSSSLPYYPQPPQSAPYLLHQPLQIPAPPPRKPRKPYSSTKPREMWSAEEHNRMVEGVRLYKRDWAQVTKMVRTRTAAQVRSHAQKWFDRLEREGGGEQIPTARKKRRCKDPYPKKMEVGEERGVNGRWVWRNGGNACIVYKNVAMVPPEARALRSVGVGHGVQQGSLDKVEAKEGKEKNEVVRQNSKEGDTKVNEKSGAGGNPRSDSEKLKVDQGSKGQQQQKEFGERQQESLQQRQQQHPREQQEAQQRRLQEEQSKRSQFSSLQTAPPLSPISPAFSLSHFASPAIAAAATGGPTSMGMASPHVASPYPLPHASPSMVGSPYHPAYHQMHHPASCSPHMMPPRMFSHYPAAPHHHHNYPYPPAGHVQHSQTHAPTAMQYYPHGSPSPCHCCTHPHTHLPQRSNVSPSQLAHYHQEQAYPSTYPSSHLYPAVMSPVTPYYPPGAFYPPTAGHPASLSKPDVSTGKRCMQHMNTTDRGVVDKCAKCTALRKFGSAMVEVGEHATTQGMAAGLSTQGAVESEGTQLGGAAQRAGRKSQSVASDKVKDGVKDMESQASSREGGKKLGKRQREGSEGSKRAKKRRRSVDTIREDTLEVRKEKPVVTTQLEKRTTASIEKEDRHEREHDGLSGDDHEMFDAVQTLQILASANNSNSNQDNRTAKKAKGAAHKQKMNDTGTAASA